jgi:hypothetical protein
MVLRSVMSGGAAEVAAVFGPSAGFPGGSDAQMELLRAAAKNKESMRVFDLIMCHPL